MVDELRRIVEESEIMREDDANWPKRNSTGRQELEVRLGKEHISFEVSLSTLWRETLPFLPFLRFQTRKMLIPSLV